MAMITSPQPAAALFGVGRCSAGGAHGRWN